MFFTHDPWTRDASGMPERFAEELSPRKKKLHLPRNEKIQSWCESTGQWELRSRNELRIYASCAPCEHGRARDGWGCWSMGHPCSTQRGLARRLCILLVCTYPLSALAPNFNKRVHWWARVPALKTEQLRTLSMHKQTQRQPESS